MVRVEALQIGVVALEEQLAVIGHRRRRSEICDLREEPLNARKLPLRTGVGQATDDVYP